MGQTYRYCRVQKRVVPADEVIDIKEANIAHGYIPDEMPPTKHPVTGEYYTSKAKFRAVTRAAGYEEVGTAYDHGYDPSKRHKEEHRERIARMKQEIKERING